VGAGDLLKEAFANEKVDFLFIFGSIAAGEEKPESDVDLFVIGEIGLRAVSKLLQEPCGKIGREVNPHVMSRAEFVKRIHENDHFVTRVLESPILMIIGNENELRKLG
jgi:predicted nucleotidyltransferase